MKIAWSKADNQSLRGLLDRELHPGETVVWCGYPSADWQNRSWKKRWNPYAVKLLSGVTMYFVCGYLLYSVISHYVAIHPEIVAYGLGALFAIYMIAIWPDVIYAITTKRIIAVRWMRIHYVDISQIKTCSEVRHDAWTDLVFSLAQGVRIRFCGLSQHDVTENIQPLLKTVPMQIGEPRI